LIRIIPDSELAEYLKDKILVKPDYGFPTETLISITSREMEAREAEKKNRAANNKRANPKRY